MCLAEEIVQSPRDAYVANKYFYKTASTCKDSSQTLQQVKEIQVNKMLSNVHITTKMEHTNLWLILHLKR